MRIRCGVSRLWDGFVSLRDSLLLCLKMYRKKIVMCNDGMIQSETILFGEKDETKYMMNYRHIRQKYDLNKIGLK